MIHLIKSLVFPQTIPLHWYFLLTLPNSAHITHTSQALSIRSNLEYIYFISCSPCAFLLTLHTSYMISNTSLRSYLVPKSHLTLVSTGNTANFNIWFHQCFVEFDLPSHLSPNLPAHPGKNFSFSSNYLLTGIFYSLCPIQLTLLREVFSEISPNNFSSSHNYQYK